MSEQNNEMLRRIAQEISPDPEPTAEEIERRIRALNAKLSPIPTPEGQGGGEIDMQEAIEAARWVIETTAANPHSRMALVARALLSSPRVEEVRREALEEAAKVADGEALTIRDSWHAGYSAAAETIARRLRALSLQVG